MSSTASAAWPDVHHRLGEDGAVGLERALSDAGAEVGPALPMSTWPQAMPYGRPSSEITRSAR